MSGAVLQDLEYVNNTTQCYTSKSSCETDRHLHTETYTGAGVRTSRQEGTLQNGNYHGENGITHFRAELSKCSASCLSSKAKHDYNHENKSCRMIMNIDKMGKVHTVCWSWFEEAKERMIRSISAGRTSLRTLGVLLMIDFHTRQAVCRTSKVTSNRAMYRADTTWSKRVLPKTCSMAD